MTNSKYFAFDPDWEAYAIKNGLPRPSNNIPPPGTIKPLDIDFTAARPYQAKVDAEWAASHPLSSLNYDSHLIKIEVRDSTKLSVKVSYPNSSRLAASKITSLPVLFVAHGGGWVSGSHVSEEAWLLWPLYKHFNLIVVSVEYRLAPEHKFPTWIDDSWDVLKKLIAAPETFLSRANVICDTQRIILAGSSAGAAITAVLSQQCRDEGIPILGIILNVPVLCDYRHLLPKAGESNSYTECTETFLGSREMATLWNMILPSPTASADPKASPLLGNVENLPPHLIFVAGRDSLRGEAFAYARKLEEAGVAVRMEVYQGVSHNFAQYEELNSTKRFQGDLRAGLAWLLESKS